jgi:GDP-4-dehydro-6-deoxy-D-mannose reductase
LGQAVIQQLGLIEGIQTYAVGRAPVKNVFSSVIGDICDQTLISRVFKDVKPIFVLQLAANFIGTFDELYQINVVAAHQLLELAKTTGFGTRVVLMGSAAEYGAVQPTENPIREDRVLRPVSAYGTTKAWQTQLMSLYQSQGVDVVTARIFNLFGPEISENLFFGRISQQIAAVLAGIKTTIETGSLSATRDYISTVDAATQILTIMKKGKSGEIYHVASGQPVTMKSLLKQHLLNANISFSVVREAEDNSNRVGYDVPVIYADISKTSQLMTHHFGS